MASGISDVERLSCARELGPAPGNLAAVSRMSPAGISMFYASEDRDTAVAEIGAHDEAQRDFAVVGAFKSLHELRILDLFDVEAPSIFDRQRRSERSDMMFLREFAADITRPIRLDGRQHREYSPTQVLTELIRWSEAPLVDGIRLKSAQDSRPTYVLFFGPDSVTDDVVERPTALFALDSGDIEVVQLRRVIEVDSVPKWRLASQWDSTSADAPTSED